MNTENITNQAVKRAIEALQEGDAEQWKAQFVADVVFTDDGNERDFASFTSSAVGTEKFLSFDSIENGGLNIVGNFDAGQWGQFQVFFNFTVNNDGLIERLDIGQVSKQSA